MSVRANPACLDDETAEKAVNEVFESCIKDTRPFDEVVPFNSLTTSIHLQLPSDLLTHRRLDLALSLPQGETGNS
jgi:ribosomal protein S7